MKNIQVSLIPPQLCGGREALLSCSVLHQTNIRASDGDLVIPKVKDLLEPAAGVTAGAGHLPPRALRSKVK